MVHAKRWVRLFKMLAVAFFGFIIIALFRQVIVLYSAPSDAITASSPIPVFQDGNFLGNRPFPVVIEGQKDGFDSPVSCVFVLSMHASDTSCRNPVLVVPLMRGNSIFVTVNGEYVGSCGDPRGGNSSIWNSVFFFRIPEKTLALTNSVSIEIRGPSLVGILKPPFFVDGDRYRARLFLLSFLTDFLPWVFFGAGLILGLIITCAALLSMPRVDGQLFVGLVCVLTGIIFLDYAKIEFLPVSYFLFNKILVSARHAYFAIFPLAVIPFIKKKASPFIFSFGAIQLLCIVLVFAIPGDVPSLERLYAWTYLTAIPLLPYLLILLLRHGKKNREFLILILGVFVAFSTAFLDFLNLQLDGNAPYLSHYGFSILVLCVSIVVIRTMLFQYRALIEEQGRAAMFLDDATHDSLTGVFNRKILPTLANTLSPFFSVIFIDLDNFKIVNDSFGHATGDEVLKDLTLIIRQHVRTDDSVVRIGGDEFIVLLQNCHLEKAEALANQICEGVSSSNVLCSAGSALTYSVSIGVAHTGPNAARGMSSIMETIERADAAAYLSKRAGKNRVTGDQRNLQSSS